MPLNARGQAIHSIIFKYDFDRHSPDWLDKVQKEEILFHILWAFSSSPSSWHLINSYFLHCTRNSVSSHMRAQWINSATEIFYALILIPRSGVANFLGEIYLGLTKADTSALHSTRSLVIAEKCWTAFLEFLLIVKCRLSTPSSELQAGYTNLLKISIL